MGCGGSKNSADGVVQEDDVKIMKDPEAEARKKAEAEAEAAAAAAMLKAEQEAKESAAATRLQSVARGKKDREKVELMKHACDDYRVNMQAETFGECMCGWPKAAHSAEALSKKKEKTARKRMESDELRGLMAQKGFCPCERYVVNMEAANFGDCICGEAKANHSPEALASGEVTKNARVDSTEVRARFVQKETVECEMFEPDMNAAEFGMCRNCGKKRADHSEAALAAAATAKIGQRVPSAELKAQADSQKEYVDCECYEVKMGDNTVAFGTCVCGAPRNKHTEAALEAGALKESKAKGKRDSAEVRKGFAKTAAWADREVVDCPKFELDMSPNAAFGTCVCGAPKAKHSDAALAAR